MNVRQWLRRKPQPVRVHCTTANGDKLVPVDRKNPRCWAETEATIIGLCASRIEALDSKDNVLRVAELDVETQEEEQEEQPKVELSKYGRDMTQTARLIGEAYRDGANATKEAYATAFEYQTRIVDAVMRRLDSLERAWVRNLNLHQRFSAEQQGEDGEAGALAALGPIIASALSGASNGKHDTSPPSAKQGEGEE